MAKKDATEFVDVEFDGADTNGYLTSEVSEVNEEKIAKELYDVSGYDDPNLKKDDVYDAINSLEEIEVDFDKEENLSNGDKVKMTITVPEEIKKLKSGEKNITVKGLEKLKKLTEKDLKKSIKLKFEGADGFGTAKLSQNVEEGEIDLTENDIFIKDNGKLKNGDDVNLHIKESAKKSIVNSGYKYDTDNNFKFETKGLTNTVADAKEIKNYDALIRRVDESIEKLKKSDEFLKRTTKINEVGTYYRPYNDEDVEEGGMFYKATSNATLFKIIEVKRYSNRGKNAGGLLEDRIQAIGFTNINFDDNDKIKLTDMQEYKKEFEDEDTIETVKESIKEFGYKEVK